MKRSGFSLVEILIVVAILGVISRVIFETMNSARIGLGAANNQINSQQEARRAVGRIAVDLKLASPVWQVGVAEYPAVISNSGNQLDFYLPVFTGNEVTQLKAVRYFISSNQLLRRESSTNTVLASDIDTAAVLISPIFAFGNAENSVMNISVPIIKADTHFVLNSQINLRNRQVELDDEVEVDPIIEQ